MKGSENNVSVQHFKEWGQRSSKFDPFNSLSNLDRRFSESQCLTILDFSRPR